MNVHVQTLTVIFLVAAAVSLTFWRVDFIRMTISPDKIHFSCLLFNVFRLPAAAGSTVHIILYDCSIQWGTSLAWTWTFCELDLFGRVKRARRALVSQSILVTDVFAPFHLPFTDTFSSCTTAKRMVIAEASVLLYVLQTILQAGQPIHLILNKKCLNIYFIIKAKVACSFSQANTNGCANSLLNKLRKQYVQNYYYLRYIFHYAFPLVILNGGCRRGRKVLLIRMKNEQKSFWMRAVLFISCRFFSLFFPFPNNNNNKVPCACLTCHCRNHSTKKNLMCLPHWLNLCSRYLLNLQFTKIPSCKKRSSVNLNQVLCRCTTTKEEKQHEKHFTFFFCLLKMWNESGLHFKSIRLYFTVSFSFEEHFPQKPLTEH